MKDPADGLNGGRGTRYRRVTTQRQTRSLAPMPMAAHGASFVDVFAGAREELEALFVELTKVGACSHVILGQRITEGLARVATRTLQGHLAALFEKERSEVEFWPRPEGSEVRV